MMSKTMTYNKEMVFDTGCGISEEEQREIFAQINAIAEKNRLSLAAGADGISEKGKKKKAKRGFKAKKSGGLFPVLVNIAAIAALAGGFFALYTLQGKTDAEVREGARVYNTAERALIDTIRKETSSRLETKENEISVITSQLEDIDAQLRELHSSNKELSVEQKTAEDQLKSLQTEYRSALASVQDERSRILEESRAREASLQSQLESRTRELALVSKQNAAIVDLAFNEMEQLSGEQNQTAIVEAQMGAFFANLNNKINENRLDEASEIVQSMRNFLNTPAFQGLRAIQARKEMYAQTINTFETLIEEMRRNQAALATGVMSLDRSAEKTLADLKEENDQLKKTMQMSSSDTVKQLAEMKKKVDGLENDKKTLTASSAEKENQIKALNRETERLNGVIQDRENTIAARNNTITVNDRTIANRNDVLGRIRSEIEGGKAVDDMSFNEIRESLAKIQNAMRGLTP
jgi:chromosome segregation ATPase